MTLPEPDPAYLSPGSNVQSVHWPVASEMLWAWALTIPLTGVTGGLVYPGFRAAGW